MKKIMAISQEIRVAQRWFLCIALIQNVWYQYLKFPVDSFYSLEVTTRTKNRSENEQGQ